jgi:Ran GTPase-activating protein (RanGAP) involved in mRNA processing and transport
VRAICQYLELGKPVKFLELLDNKITPLGCEFISRALHPKMASQIEVLKLDHNQFGSEGMKALSEGLAINPTLRLLSLTYCGIDHEAADAIFNIMIYTRSALEEVNLSGN